MPRFYSATGSKSQEAGLSNGLSSDIAEQSRTGIVVGAKPAAVNQAIAGTALQGNTPLPPQGMCNGACIGGRRLGTFRLYCQSAVGGQPMVPVLVFNVQCTAEQQASEAGAINKEITGDLSVLLELQRLDVTRHRINGDLANLAFDSPDAE